MKPKKRLETGLQRGRDWLSLMGVLFQRKASSDQTWTRGFRIRIRIRFRFSFRPLRPSESL